jgi:hypothetical protein
LKQFLLLLAAFLSPSAHAEIPARSPAFLGGYLTRAAVICSDKSLADTGMQALASGQNRNEAFEGGRTFNSALQIKGRAVACDWARQTMVMVARQLQELRSGAPVTRY